MKKKNGQSIGGYQKEMKRNDIKKQKKKQKKG